MRYSTPKIQEVATFETILNYHWEDIFHTAQVAYDRRLQNLRKHLSIEIDIFKVRQFIIVEMDKFTDDQFS